MGDRNAWEDSPFRLDGKVSLVTGGYRGLGLGMAEGLARAGSRVVLLGRSAEPLLAAAEKLAKETGTEVAPLAGDVSDTAGVDDLVNRAVGVFGQLDVLVNAAGTQVRKPFLEISPAEFDRVLAALTSTSSWPKIPTARSTRSPSPAVSLTSPASGTTSAPVSLASFWAAAPSGSLLRPSSTTWLPARARPSAIPSPRPR